MNARKPCVVATARDSTLLAKAETAPNGKKAPKLNVDQKGVMLKGYDPVAYFKQGKAVKGEPKYSSIYQGATYYFASSADKSEFEFSVGPAYPLKHDAWRIGHEVRKPVFGFPRGFLRGFAKPRLAQKDGDENRDHRGAQYPGGQIEP